jgi:acyl-CoA thioester hydrolase
MWNVTRAYKSTSAFRVRYAETDQMGVVYHTHYLVWCEIARTDYMRQFEISYAELERTGLLLAVSEAQVRYVGSARYENVISVECWLERAQSRMLTFGYEIFRAEPQPKQLLATAVTKLIAMNRDGTTRQIPTEVIGKFKHAQVART